MGSDSNGKLPRQAEALAKKAHALASRLAKQNARILAAAHQIGRAKGRSGIATNSFSAGAKLGASLFGRPKSSIRAKSSEGKEVFHCRITPVSRGSEFSNLISGRSPPKASAVHGDSAKSSSAAHQLYIERDSAVEVSRLSPSTKLNADLDLERDRVEGLLTTPDQAGYAAAAAAYIDRDGGLVAASFGNISDTLEERIAFWRAIEQAERRPATNKVIANPGIDAEFWNHVATDNEAPEFLKKIASSAKDEIIAEQLREKDTKKVHDYFVAHRTTKNEDAQAVTFNPGRGGRVQTRIVMELPADMTAEQRLEIAKSFCEKEFQQKPGIRFHCAIHSPTPANDERNFHFHVVFHDRPTEKIINPEIGLQVWDFEIIEKKRDSSRHYVNKRPLQQEKIREFQEQKWPYKVRRDYTDIVNGIRKKYKMAPIYDHRSYKEMGIEVEAVPSLTRKEFHDVQRGVENSEAASKIQKRWDRALFKAADETRLELPDRAATARFIALIANVAKRAPVSLVAARATHGAYLDSIKRINDSRLDRIALKIAIEKELSALTPEIGAPVADAKGRAATLHRLHLDLAKPLEVHEQLARESKRLALEKLAILEKQLKAISPGSLSLPFSLGDLAARAGLTGIIQMLQSNGDPIVNPDQKPAAKKATSLQQAPSVTPASAPSTQKVPSKDAPEKSPAPVATKAIHTGTPVNRATPTAAIPREPITTTHADLTHDHTTPAPASAPAPEKRAKIIQERPKLADPQIWRIKPAVRKTPASPSSPSPQKSDTRQETNPGSSGQEIKPAVKQEIKPDQSILPQSTTSSTSPVKSRFKDLPARLLSSKSKTGEANSTHPKHLTSTKSQLGKPPSPPSEPSKAAEAIKTTVKTDQKVMRPIEPSPNSATPVLSGKTTSSQSDHKTIKRTVTPLSPTNDQSKTPQSGNDANLQAPTKKDKDSLNPNQIISRASSSPSNPEKSLPEPDTVTIATTAPLSPPQPPPPPPPSDDETARKEKERRDRRRAILTTPPRPPKGRGGGHER